MSAASITLGSWMAHAVIVGLLLAGAAWCLDRVLARAGLSTRWVWIGSLALSALVPVSGLTIAQGSVGSGAGAALPDASAALAWLIQPVTGAGTGAGAAAPWPVSLLGQASSLVTAGVEAAMGVVPATAAFGTIVVAIWTLGSLTLLALLLRAQLGMARRRRSWPRAELHGRTVRMTPDLGPAVVGLLRPEIVVPAWARSLATDELELVLAHEGEHVRGRDPLLLHVALLPLVLFPWNPGLWWQFRRLRDAVEVDCDRRVLRRGTEPASYGRLLVRLGARAGRDIVPAPAMSGSPSLLERRLNAMKKRSLRTTLPLAVLGTAAGILLAAVACEVEPPAAPSGSDESAGQPGVTDVTVQPGVTDRTPGELAQEPVFTPYEVAPEVRNAAHVQRVLEREYPSQLRDAGMGGTVVLHFFITDGGEVDNALVANSSGHTEIDEAALRVAREFEFVPARMQDEAVPVWVQIPITFQTR